MDKECNNRITELIKERDEARSAKTKQEIIHDNELLGVSKQCNYLEDKLHEKTVDSETHRILQSNMDKLKISAKLNQNALDLANKKNIKLEKEKEDCKKKVRDMIAEKNLSESSRALIEQKAVFTT